MAAATAAKSGKSTLIVTVAALTVLAAIGGGLVGKVISGKIHAQPGTAPAAAAASKPLPYPPDVELRELPAVVANLAEPADAHVRLQVAIVYKKAAVELPSILAAQIDDDIVAYIKTVTLSQLQGASGLQALREDLNDRAVTRSNGKVRELIIENLVVQ